MGLRNHDVDPYASYVDRSIANQNAAVFFQGEFQVLDNLILSAGLRYDYVNSNYNRVNPRIALIYDPQPTTTLKFLYGTAFRAANGYEAYYEDGGLTTKANPDVKPETVTTYELVGEQGIGDHLRASVSGFYSNIEDLIGSVIDPSDELYVSANTDKVKLYGTEVELEARWANGVRGRTSYTFAETDNETTGKRLDNSPQHLVKLNVAAPLYEDKAFAGFELQYTSSRNTFEGGKVDGFTVANLTLSAQKFWRGLEASASVYNLFNEKFSDPSASFPYAIEQDGTTFHVKLTYHF